MRTISTPDSCAATSSTRLSAALIGMSLILAAVSADSSITAISARAARPLKNASARSQASQPGASLLAHVSWSGSPIRSAALDRAVDAQHGERLLGDARLDALHF